MPTHQPAKSTNPGKLIYLIGASGSGKDSLLLALTQRHLKGVVIARRYITRSVRAGCEDHICVNVTEFTSCIRAEKFLFHWQAYGFHYGIGCEVLLDLDEGRHVIINGSRGYLATAQQIYPDLVPVCLEVEPTVLEARLRQRGREAPSEISSRLRRATKYSDRMPDHTIRLRNDGEIEITTRQFLKVLAGC